MWSIRREMPRSPPRLPSAEWWFQSFRWALRPPGRTFRVATGSSAAWRAAVSSSRLRSPPARSSPRAPRPIRDAKCSRCPARSTRRSPRGATRSSSRVPSSSSRPRTCSPSSADSAPAGMPRRRKTSRQRRTRACSPTWATIRSTSTLFARAPDCRPNRLLPSCCAWSSTAASPPFRAVCTSGCRRGREGKPESSAIVNKKGDAMYDILVYLFENCQQAELAYDRERVARKLSAAGFEDSDISEALHWLAGVVRAPQGAVREPLPDVRSSFRAYAPRELAKLDAACRGFLITLEHSGILNAEMRELVIERALAASGEALSLEQLKLVALMVLWNQQTPTSRLLAEDLFAAPHARAPS